jgi:hemerythrin-like metal-binding protein
MELERSGVPAGLTCRSLPVTAAVPEPSHATMKTNAPVPPSTHVQWRADFECSDPLINEQHRMLFHKVNEMMTAVAAGDSARAIEYLDELVMHTIEHFRYEEEVLRQCRYPDLREHQLDHLALLERALNLRHDVVKGAMPLADMIEFLVREVIVNHLIEADRHFFPSLARPTATFAGP